MQRRQFLYFSSTSALLLATASALVSLEAQAQGIDLGEQGKKLLGGLLGGNSGALSQEDAVLGLREALTRGAGSAVGKLGIADGFWNNAKVKIPLPGYIDDVASVARMLGQGKRIDDLHLSLNRAAEAAVPQAKDMLVESVRTMSVNDALGIVRGSDNSATQYFKSKTEQPLFGKFLPIVTQVTGQVGLAKQYNDFISKVPIKGTERIENHVTQKSLDGLYLMIADEERAIRKDPVGTGSALLKKVFG